MGRPGDWPLLRAQGRQFVEQERNWTASVAHYVPAYRRLLPSLAV